MSRGRGFQVNQRGIDKHVKKIAQGYEKAWRRHGPTLPVETDVAPAEPPLGWYTGTEQQVAETVSRSVRIQREFFRWFVENDDEAPGWAAFLTEVGAVDGAEVTEKELRAAVRLLVADGLLGGPPDPDPRNDLPALLQVTTEGERCAAVYDGNIARWDRARRGGVGPTVYNDHRDQRTYATNTTGPVVSHSPGARINQHGAQTEVDLRTIQRAVHFLLANLDDLAEDGFDAASREAVAKQGSALVVELEETDPDLARVRTLGERLNTTLMSHPMSAGVAGGLASGTLSGPVTAMLSAALGLPPG